MKKYMISMIAVLLALNISSCTKTNDKFVNESQENNKEDISKNIENVNEENSNLEKQEELAKSYKESENLNKPDINEAKDFDLSLKNGSVIMLYNNNEHEVYNISTLDRFLESFNNGRRDYVRIIKGMRKEDGTLLVNKLEEYETDGNIIKSTPYDTYSNKGEYTKGSSSYDFKMVKSESDKDIRYSVLLNNETPENMGGTVISFSKSSIKN